MLLGCIPAVLMAWVKLPAALPVAWALAAEVLCQVMRLRGFEIERGKPGLIYGLNVHYSMSANSFLMLVERFLSSIDSPFCFARF